MASRSGGGGGHYVATKAALNGWVLALSTEFAPQGITANVVVPGYTPGTGLYLGAPGGRAPPGRVTNRSGPASPAFRDCGRCPILCFSGCLLHHGSNPRGQRRRTPTEPLIGGIDRESDYLMIPSR